MTKEDPYRVEGKIVGAGGDDRSRFSLSITIVGAGWGQGFGGLAFATQELYDDFVTDLCETFGVEKLADLYGLPCFALYCFPRDSIEGLEAQSGKRFVLTTWRRKHDPAAHTPLTAATHRAKQEAVRLIKQGLAMLERVDDIAEDYRPVS